MKENREKLSERFRIKYILWNRETLKSEKVQGLRRFPDGIKEIRFKGKIPFKIAVPGELKCLQKLNDKSSALEWIK